ncbi:hypothetical protein C1646_750615 [Rhizophagus diaphanus]|nr:hypothetical protein C1646_750615 [Rhizophagus diaphanus] [Rhizophagus sp. MUCL 43196]
MPKTRYKLQNSLPSQPKQMGDQNKSSYSKIKQITNTRNNNKPNRAPPRQDNYNGNTSQRHLYQSHVEGMHNWDNNTPSNKTQNTRPTYSTQKRTVGNNNNNKQNDNGVPNNVTMNPANDNKEISQLKEKITYLETVIKDISSQLEVMNMHQKTHFEDIKLLKTQERQHTMKLESISQNCNQIQNTINNQAVTINEIPKMLAILQDIQANSLRTSDASTNEAYESSNYAHPPHQFYEEEQNYNNSQSDYADSNTGYELSDTVNNVIYPNENYTPSRVRSGFPSISSTGGFMMDNKIINTLKRVQNKILYISSSFNIKTKNNKNSTKKAGPLTLNLDDNNITNIPDPQQYTLYLDLIHDYKQIKIATHNIQGGFNKKKKDDIIQLMILEHIEFMHGNSQKKYFIINNPNKIKTGGGSALIISEQLHRHLETTTIICQRDNNRTTSKIEFATS